MSTRTGALPGESDVGTTFPPPLVFIQGWPDTTRLWDRQVEALEGEYRCVLLALPGFDRQSRRAYSDAEVIEHIRAAIDRECPGERVTLVLHDFGCVYGYAFAARHPELVDRIIGVDVGDGGSRRHLREIGTAAKLMIAGYQIWLALSWLIGGAIGNAMGRTFARIAGAPAPSRDIHSGMAWPYAVRWLRVAGGAPRRTRPPAVPMLYIYGERKPFMLHSSAWAEEKASEAGSRVVPMAAGHWMMVTHPEEFNAAVKDWLGHVRPVPASI